MDQQSGRQRSENHPNQKTKRRKNVFKNEDSLRDLLDNTKHTNIHITGVSNGEEKEKRQKTYVKK